MELASGRLVVISVDRALSAHRWLPPREGGAFTFSAGGDAGFSVEADSAAPRLLGAPFAVDLNPGNCYAVLAGGQVIKRGCFTCSPAEDYPE